MLDPLLAIENRLSTLIPQTDILHRAMNYSLLGGGKRLRALFTMYTAITLDHNQFTTAIDIACAIECLHTYSLIHDDLPCMDDDDERRGRPSLHKAFSENVALLAGDALLTLAFQLISAQKNLSYRQRTLITEKVSLLAGSKGMINGQIRDISQDINVMSKQTTLHMYELKTANLFIAALESGAIIGEAGDIFFDAIGSFGRAFGLAFQILDDIEDGHLHSDELVVQRFGLDELSAWYEETREKAHIILSKITPPIPFLYRALTTLDRKLPCS